MQTQIPKYLRSPTRRHPPEHQPEHEPLGRESRCTTHGSGACDGSPRRKPATEACGGSLRRKPAMSSVVFPSIPGVRLPVSMMNQAHLDYSNSTVHPS